MNMKTIHLNKALICRGEGGISCFDMETYCDIKLAVSWTRLTLLWLDPSLTSVLSCFRLLVRPSWTAAVAAARSVSQPQLRAHQAPPRSNWSQPMRRPSSSTKLKTLRPSCPSPARATGPSLADGHSFLPSFHPPSLVLLNSIVSSLLPPCLLWTHFLFSPADHLSFFLCTTCMIFLCGHRVSPPASSLQEVKSIVRLEKLLSLHNQLFWKKEPVSGLSEWIICPTSCGNDVRWATMNVVFGWPEVFMYFMGR